MPPKRKVQDTTAAMARPEKKRKTAKKDQKAAPAAADGKLSLLIICNTCPYPTKLGEVRSRWRLAIVVVALIPGLGTRRAANGGLLVRLGSSCCLDDASHLAQDITNNSSPPTILQSMSPRSSLAFK